MEDKDSLFIFNENSAFIIPSHKQKSLSDLVFSCLKYLDSFNSFKKGNFKLLKASFDYSYVDLVTLEGYSLARFFFTFDFEKKILSFSGKFKASIYDTYHNFNDSFVMTTDHFGYQDNLISIVDSILGINGGQDES